jgi:hypothetical protein
MISKIFLFIFLLTSANLVFSQEKNNFNQYKKSNLDLLISLDLKRQNIKDSLKYLIPILDSVYDRDQRYRAKTIGNSEGDGMSVFLANVKTIHELDAINLGIVENILTKYGWLSNKEIGIVGNKAIFLTIQHADIETQQKWLPILKEAVISKNEDPFHLCLLEDRILLRSKHEQLYGTQFLYYKPDNRYYIQPIQNPDSLFIRRNMVGLDSVSLNTYYKQFNLQWDKAVYYKDLNRLKVILKKQHK